MLYGSDYLTPSGRLKLEDFRVGSTSYLARGKWVFYNAASNAIYVLAQADPASGILDDFAVQVFPLTPASCSAAFALASAAAAATGAGGAVGITAAGPCVYQAVSSAPWLQIVSGGFGSGNGVLKYLARANPGPARQATISIGAASFTIAQQAASPLPPFIPLPYNVTAAAYAKSSDRLIMVSTEPNELHIYDPLSGSEQALPLPAVPLSISLRPDGKFAAVGYDGFVSYVNLQTVVIENTYAVAASASQVLLPANGYLYVFPTNSGFGVASAAVNLSTGLRTDISGYYGYGIPRLYSDGSSVYFSSSSIQKWTLNQSAMTQVTTPYSTNSCGDIWLTEDGRRVFTACGYIYRTSPAPAEDLQPNGSVRTGNVTGLAWADEASVPKLTAVLAVLNYANAGATELRIYDDAFLQMQFRLPMYPFRVGNTNYNGFGKFVFWNAAESKVVVVEKADPAANLAASYGVAVMTPERRPRGQITSH